jgi:hypothetical protein
METDPVATASGSDKAKAQPKGWTLNFLNGIRHLRNEE